MNQPEALTILGVSDSSSLEEINRSYKEKYFELDRLAKNGLSDEKAMEEKLRMVNKAFMSLDSNARNAPIQDPGLKLNLGTDLADFKPNQSANFEVFPEFKKLVDRSTELAKQEKHGLAIRLLEIGIQRSFQQNRYKAFTGQKHLLRTLGKVLLEIGLKDEGVELLTAGSVNYYIGKTYFEIKDYQSAIVHFGRELQDKKAKVSSEDIILSIVKCYFLLGEYANALHIIEKVLPNFENASKGKFLPNDNMSNMILFAISKVENLNRGMLVKFKLKLKYPVSYRCITQSNNSFQESLIFLDNIKEEEAFDQFYKSLEPSFVVTDNVGMYYSEEELNEVYYEIFSEPLNASQLYNRKN